MTGRDQGSYPLVPLLAYSNVPTVQRPILVLPGRPGLKENIAPVGPLYQRSLFLWKLEERVLERSTGASIGKARISTGPSNRSGKEINYMIKLLVELPLIGKFTIIVVWHRKGRR
jgi:hypothetical protein